MFSCTLFINMHIIFILNVYSYKLFIKCEFEQTHFA